MDTKLLLASAICLALSLSNINTNRAAAEEETWVFGNPIEYQTPEEDWTPDTTPINNNTPQVPQKNTAPLPQPQQNYQPQTYIQMPISNIPQGIKIPSGTAVMIHNTQEINADHLKKGQTVEFVVDNSVIINGISVIQSGARVTAEVLNKKNNFIFGIPGEIQIGNFKLNNVTTEPINMLGTITEKGSSRYWAHIGWLVVWPLLLVKGGDGVIHAGTRQTVYTIRDTYLNNRIYPINYNSIQY